jgi:hypothetical protein
VPARSNLKYRHDNQLNGGEPIMKKFDIVNALGRATSEARYLEIGTPLTGKQFAGVDPDVFAVRHRLMYSCPESFEDGLDITFRTTATSSHELVRSLHAMQDSGGYDVIFVDPWHTYDATITDLQGALWLLRPGGILVVHDCSPEDPRTLTAEQTDGAWCGLTYRAFIDFVLAADPAGYCVVDCDYGCGLVFTQPARLPQGLPTGRPPQRLIFEWTLSCREGSDPYPFFDSHRHELLNLVTPLTFINACDLSWPSTIPAATNFITNGNWSPSTAGWCVGDVETTPVEFVGPSASLPPRGLMLQARSMVEGAEVDALWAAPLRDTGHSNYDATYEIVPGESYEAQIRAAPRDGALQLLLLFVDAKGGIVGSPRADARPPAASGPPSAGPRWQKLTVCGRAPADAKFATILLRLINYGPGQQAPSALVTEAILGHTAPDRGTTSGDWGEWRRLTGGLLEPPQTEPANTNAPKPAKTKYPATLRKSAASGPLPRGLADSHASLELGAVAQEAANQH